MLLLLLVLTHTAAAANAPEWLRELARAPLPSYPTETRGVLLLDEQITTVTDNGEIRTLYRRAFRILRTSGRDLGEAVVFHDNETKLFSFRAWSIPAQGSEYEVKEKEALETAAFSGSLYSDDRVKVIKIPAAEPGSVVGYEYEQRRRPEVMQDVWAFQEDIPVRKSRFVLNLPAGWEMQAYWLNADKKEPSTSGNQLVWELTDIPAIKKEPNMPARRAVAGKMAVKFFSSSRGRTQNSWQEVGTWYNQLASSRRQITPEIQQKTRELIAGKTTVVDKLRTLGAFAQRDVRYVAIEIGIGGYQPHMAQEVFSNRYGDCKDKVTLLSTMLHEAGVESYYVLTHSDRGVVASKFPSMSSFNHVIVAVRIPESEKTDKLYSTVQHESLGKLLLFDPTSSMTPVGYLPSSLQGNYGLLVTEKGGDLLSFPLQPPAANTLKRTANLTLSPAGGLSGQVREVRTGEHAVSYRSELLALQSQNRVKKMENFLSLFLTGFVLKDFQVENLEDFDKELVVTYNFEADNYAKQLGALLLVRPRVFGSKSEGIIDMKERKYSFEVDAPSLQNDEFNITLPAGYAVDELPPPVKVSSAPASYSSETKFEGNTLSYKRQFTVEQVMIPLDKMPELNTVYKQIVFDERNSAVLKRIQ